MHSGRGFVGLRLFREMICAVKYGFLISEFGIPRQPLDNSWELVAAQIRRNPDPRGAAEQISIQLVADRVRNSSGYFDTEASRAGFYIFRM